MKRFYGCLPDLYDSRDKLFTIKRAVEKYPTMVDMRTVMPPVYDQGRLGSCTAQALCANVHFNLVNVRPSRLFVYYNERMIEGTTATDSGASLRDGIKTLNLDGVCPEDMWQYDISMFAQKPPKVCYNRALQFQALEYERVNNFSLDDMKHVLAVHQKPFVIGMSVYSYMESKDMEQTGVLKMPHFFERYLGGHAVLVVGYNDRNKMFIVRNSWGSKWGQDGYFMMPYRYMTNRKLVRDCWFINKMETGE